MNIAQGVFRIELSLEEIRAIQNFIGQTSRGEAVGHKVSEKEWILLTNIHDNIIEVFKHKDIDSP